jgi:hypothetical protein
MNLENYTGPLFLTFACRNLRFNTWGKQLRACQENGMGLDGRVYWVWKVDRMHLQNPNFSLVGDLAWKKQPPASSIADRQTSKIEMFLVSEIMN